MIVVLVREYFLTSYITMTKPLFIGILLIGTVPQTEAQTKPEPFLAATFGNIANVRDIAISTDGTEIYFTAESPKKDFSAILFMRSGKGGKWSAPEIAAFSGKYRDLEPFLSPDGLQLFFASARPNDANSTQPKDVDIWRVTRSAIGGAWSEPENLGNIVNTDKDEYYPSVASSGNLYFTRFAQDKSRKEDIFISRWENGKYIAPQALSDSVNSKTYEFNAFIAPDESYILFTSYGRSDDLGGGDLYIAHRNKEGGWQPAQHLGNDVNSTKIDYCPFVDKNGVLYFTSERNEIPAYQEKKTTWKGLQSQFQQYANGMGRIYTVRLTIAH